MPKGDCSSGRQDRGGRSIVVVEPHKHHKGVFILKGETDRLCTVNMVPGVSVNNETLHSVHYRDGSVVEYRLWDSSGSDLAAVILKGVRTIYIKPGSKVLYLGAHPCTTSHLSDIVGFDGMVYAVTSNSSPTLSNLEHKRHNVQYISQDPLVPQMYANRVLDEVSVILSEVHGPLQTEMMYRNASCFMKPGGHFVVSVKGDYKATFFPFTSPRTVIDEDFRRLLYRQFKHSWEVNLALDHLYFLGSWLGDSSSVAQISKVDVGQVCAEPDPGSEMYICCLMKLGVERIAKETNIEQVTGNETRPNANDQIPECESDMVSYWD